MKEYRPKNILLCRDTPLDQCLCDKCKNIEQLLQTFHAIGLNSIPANRYDIVDQVVCPDRKEQTGVDFSFPLMKCITGACQDCGEEKLNEEIRNSNRESFAENKKISWRKWMMRSGKSAPEKCQIKGTLKQSIEELLFSVRTFKAHIFWANWNRNLFEYSRKNITDGQIIQIFDFAMNFCNMYQDEIQSAYWEGSQTAIHAVINYFPCPHCAENVTLILVQITDNLKHNSFVARVGHDLAFKYLADLNLRMDSIIQFCNNCSVQYKSRHPFAEMARSPFNIIHIYFGEKTRQEPM